jgi:hypothetical protein
LALSDLKSLKEFELYGSLKTADMPSQLHLLPISLKHLRLPWVPEEGFSGLPSSLTSLTMILFGDNSHVMDIAKISTLPRALTRLSAPLLIPTENIPAILAVLPPHIASFSTQMLQQSQIEPFFRAYYSHPDWEGTMNPIFGASV